MKARIEAATDVAMTGPWDAQRNATPFSAAELASHLEALERDAVEGHLFLIHTGGDIGGAIDVYVEEAAPAAVRDRFTAIAGPILIALPSGTLMVGGVEDYRTGRAGTSAAGGTIEVPTGDYALRCSAAADPEREPASESALRTIVSPADIKYYDRITRQGCLGGVLTLLLFPLLAFAFGWPAALVITAVTFLAFFPLLAAGLKRNARYQRLHAIVPVFRLQHADPLFVIELHRVESRAGLTGGSVSSQKTPTSERSRRRLPARRRLPHSAAASA